MKKEAFTSDKAYSQNSRYSQVIKYGNVAFLSGQVAIDKDTGAPLGGSIHDQSQFILTSIKNILSDLNLDLSSILMMRCYISDISKVSEMNEVYENFFKEVEVLPARCTVEANMGDFDVEMYAIVGLE